MRLDDLPTSDNVRDLGRGRGGGGGFGGGGMGGGMLGAILPLVGRRFGCLGIGAVLVLMMLFGGGGSLLGGLFGGGSSGVSSQQAAGTGATDNAQQACNATPLRRSVCQTKYSLEQVWGGLLQGYRPANLAFYTGGGQSGCGAAMSAMGPFYCPPDNGVYIDTVFFDELAGKYGAQGDFAQDYVVAHEVGHHIQNLDGTADQVRQAQSRAGRAGANELQVRMELQADCYAGVWGARAVDAQGRRAIEPGDVEEGMTAASAIGDDTLQRQAGARVSPESFTHGSSEQRMRWLRRGLESGDPRSCDTFGARIL